MHFICREHPPPGEAAARPGWRAALERLAWFLCSLLQSPQLRKCKGEHEGGGAGGGSGKEPTMAGLQGQVRVPQGGVPLDHLLPRLSPPEAFVLATQRVQNLVSQQAETLFPRI